MSGLLTGAPVAAAMDGETAARVSALGAKGIVPTLALLRVGDRADVAAYERAATKRAEKLGIETRSVALPENTEQAALICELEKLNADASVHGILMFRPLPGTLDERAACAAISPEKDVDGVTPSSMSRTYSGAGAGYPPCTAQSVMELLRYYGAEPAGKRAAVIGRSLVIGRPVAMLLLAANATVTLCHSQTAELPSVTREADVVVAAIGCGESLGAEFFRAGQTVIDVGVNRSETKGKLVGDVDFDAVEPVVGAITPVPGGVGSVTTAVLCRHVVEAAERAGV